MPTTITSAGITFNDATSLTSANGVPSALKLTTARTINGVSFDGTANIDVPASGVSAAKAWVNFNGTTSPGTIRSSYNVSSVTKNGTGDYTVNFATAMADANYSFNSNITNDNISSRFSFEVGTYGQYRSINSVRLAVVNGNTTAGADAQGIYVQIFGN